MGSGEGGIDALQCRDATAQPTAPHPRNRMQPRPSPGPVDVSRAERRMAAGPLTRCGERWRKLTMDAPRPIDDAERWRVIVVINVPRGAVYRLVDDVVRPLGHR